MTPSETYRRLRRVSRLPDVIGDYPLESGLAVWGFFIGLVFVTGTKASGVLQQLPGFLGIAWGFIALVGGISMLFGLWRRQISPAIANAMLLFAVAFAVYAITVVQVTGFPSGGAVGGLTGVLAVVCYLRSRRLREVWRVLMKEAHRLGQCDEGGPHDANPT